MTAAGRAARTRWATPASLCPVPPATDLLWPADHSWCVSTEIDSESTLVGGSKDLNSAMLTTPGLDAWPDEPDDDLAASTESPNTSS